MDFIGDTGFHELPNCRYKHVGSRCPGPQQTAMDRFKGLNLEVLKGGPGNIVTLRSYVLYILCLSMTIM